jgi:hypothetical protein
VTPGVAACYHSGAMRVVALLLVALTFMAGAPRAARAAHAHCCCPPGAHARTAQRSNAADAPTFVRVCPCDVRPAPAKPPGGAPAVLPLPLTQDAPAAIVTSVLPAIAPVAPIVARLRRPEAARAPPRARSLFEQHVALVV